MELAVLKIDGTQSGKTVTLDEKVFGITPNDHAIYLDVVQFLANQRHGNAKTKDRSETAYSTKKLGRQKGGGGARHGSRKANIFVGGGRVFGPVPRFYHNKLNKKVPVPCHWESCPICLAALPGSFHLGDFTGIAVSASGSCGQNCPEESKDLALSPVPHSPCTGLLSRLQTGLPLNAWVVWVLRCLH